MDNNYYVYIMSNLNNKVVYIGITNDLIKRVYQHKEKLFDGFTKKYNVNKLVYFEITSDVYSAITREKYLKGKTRSFKNDLISKFNSEWKDLYDEITK